MLMSDSKITKWLQYAAAALLLVLLILQCTPFWSLGDEAGTTSSLGSYVWFPESNKDTGKYLSANVEGFTVNDIVPTSVLIWILGAAGILAAMFMNGHVVSSAAHILTGVCGAWGYLTQPALQLGLNWSLHLILCLALILCGVVSLVSAVREIRTYRTAAPVKVS